MTDEQIKSALTEWVKDYCNNDFLVKNPDYDSEDAESEEYIEELPDGVELFLNQAVDFTKNQTGKKSESLGDYSVSWETGFPPSMLMFLAPYRSMYPKSGKSNIEGINVSNWRVVSYD